MMLLMEWDCWDGATAAGSSVVRLRKADEGTADGMLETALRRLREVVALLLEGGDLPVSEDHILAAADVRERAFKRANREPERSVRLPPQLLLQ